MKHNILLITLCISLGFSCKQKSDKTLQAQSVIIENEVTFAEQDSIFAESILDIEDESSTPKLSQQLLSFLEQNPTTFNYPFPKLTEAGVHIVNSPDQKLRIYSWDDNQGGSMRYFNNMFQAVTDNKQILKLLLTKEDRVYYPYYTKIENFTIDGQLYYLAFARNIFSNREVNYSVEIYKIDKDSILPANLFNTPEGLDYVLGDTFNYDELGDSDVEFIQFNAKNLTITFPEVTEDGIFSKKLTTYQFKNNYFEKK